MIGKRLLLLYFIFTSSLSFAQKNPGVTSIKQIVATVDTFNARLPGEQLYLHFDKPYYAVGDTMWFKAYLLQTLTHAYSPISGLLYLEIITDSNKVVRRMSVPVSFGVTWGQIPLNRENISEGNYSIRAYTNWMQNFGEEYFFRQRFSIIDAGTQNWMVSESHILTAAEDKENLSLHLQLKKPGTVSLKNRNIGLKIFSGTKELVKKDVTTDANGIINEEYILPVKNKNSRNLSVVLQDKNDPSLKSGIPLIINQPENTDLQFMPESSNLVAGLPSRVGFKAIGENGLGTDVHGKIVDSKNNEVTAFSSGYRGMGIFEMVPVKGEEYFAVTEFTGGSTRRYPLPPVKNSGIVLRVDNAASDDSLAFSVYCSPDLVNSDLYHMGIFCRGACYFAAGFRFNTSLVRAKVDKKIFPSGVIHFTLMDPSGVPLNERMTFIDHGDELGISVLPLVSNFTSRDSIPLLIKVADRSGIPVAGTFSLSVTDDAQVERDTMNAENMITRMLLTSELKGYVETPGYYLHPGNERSKQAMDALMLTQGWVGYDWKKIYKPPVPAFPGERSFAVSGKVTNLFNKPVVNSSVILVSTGSSMQFKNTVTDEKGHFRFSDFPAVDSVAFFVQARNARGRSNGIGIDLDEFTAANVKQVLPAVMPWNVNPDPVMQVYVQNNFLRQAEESKKYKVLSVVTVSSKKRIRNSKNLNGSGEADQVINELDLSNAGRKNLLDILRERVKGFRITYVAGGDQRYWINSDKVNIVIDGLLLSRFGYERETLESLEASDITGIEVMHSERFSSNYATTFLPIEEQMDIMRRSSFIEVTTRSGNGIFMRKTPGVAIYRPVSVSMPRQFYNPRYSVNDRIQTGADKRSTIYWQPNVITNAKGEATVSFYASDTPGPYSIVIQGTDLNGAIGYTFIKIGGTTKPVDSK